jgi:hypothetical protein
MVQARGLVVFALAMAGLGRTAFAQDAQLPAIVVNCVDGDGHPVAGAAVHVFQFQPTAEGPYRLVPARPFVSGTDGSVRTPSCPANWSAPRDACRESAATVIASRCSSRPRVRCKDA